MRLAQPDSTNYSCTNHLYNWSQPMQAVKISELRANLMYYLKQASEGNEIVVTSRGEAVATILPPMDKRKNARAQLNRLAKTAKIGDVLAPIGETWDVDK